MDFDLTDEQQATIDVAAKLLGDKATPEAVRAVEHADDLRFDRALWAAMADAGKVYEKAVFPGVDHAFHNDTRERYNAEAAMAAWAQTLAWFDEHLKGEPGA